MVIPITLTFLIMIQDISSWDIQTMDAGSFNKNKRTIPNGCLINLIIR